MDRGHRFPPRITYKTRTYSATELNSHKKALSTFVQAATLYASHRQDFNSQRNTLFKETSEDI